MSTPAMRDYIQEMYAMDISAAEISRITKSLLPAVRNGAIVRLRPSTTLYFGLYIFKVRVNRVVETRAISNILGVDIEGKKDVLGLYTAENEGAKFWLSVFG